MCGYMWKIRMLRLSMGGVLRGALGGVLLALSAILLTFAVTTAQQPASVPSAVDALTQCRAYIGIIIRERDQSHADLATHAARVEVLMAEKSALEVKVKALEAKGPAKEP